MLDRGRRAEVGYRHEGERGDVRRRPGWFGVRIDHIGLSEKQDDRLLRRLEDH